MTAASTTPLTVLSSSMALTLSAFATSEETSTLIQVFSSMVPYSGRGKKELLRPDAQKTFAPTVSHRGEFRTHAALSLGYASPIASGSHGR